MFRTAKVSEKNPSAVQLRTIRSDSSTIPWLWLCWHKCLKQRNICCSSTSLILTHLQHLRRTQGERFTAATADQSSVLVLNLFFECQTLTSVQRCHQLTTLDETLLMSSSSACQWSPVGLWQMR